MSVFLIVHHYLAIGRYCWGHPTHRHRTRGNQVSTAEVVSPLLTSTHSPGRYCSGYWRWRSYQQSCPVMSPVNCKNDQCGKIWSPIPGWHECYGTNSHFLIGSEFQFTGGDTCQVLQVWARIRGLQAPGMALLLLFCQMDIISNFPLIIYFILCFR